VTEYRLSQDGFPSTYEFHAERPAVDHLSEAGHRRRLLTVVELIEGLDPQPTSWIDYGCGAGGLLSLVGGITNKRGFDFHLPAVQLGRNHGRPVEYLNFAWANELPHTDLATMTEVLEHLDDPHGFLEGLPCERLIASVPVNETPDAHCEEHVWAWDRAGFAAMLRDAGFEVRSHIDDGSSQYVVAERAVLL
jgi:hypothetical protein